VNYLDDLQLERVEAKIAEEDRFEARLFWRGLLIALIVAALIAARFVVA
jgi:hypothetical protein